MMYGKWLGLSLETRNRIAGIFNIQKKGSVEVFSNEIKSDGYLVHDIEAALTIEGMQRYLSCEETDREKLANMLIEKIESEGRPKVTGTPVPPEIKATGTIEKIEKISEVKPKKTKKTAVKKVTKKNAKNK